MKEQIQKLAEQANIKYGAAVDYFYSPATDGVTRQDMEKFAELIVQECVNCCDEVDRLNKSFIQCYDFDPQNGPEECIQAIKEHFGVTD